jgi:hypothetical protein
MLRASPAWVKLPAAADAWKMRSLSQSIFGMVRCKRAQETVQLNAANKNNSSSMPGVVSGRRTP